MRAIIDNNNDFLEFLFKKLFEIANNINPTTGPEAIVPPASIHAEAGPLSQKIIGAKEKKRRKKDIPLTHAFIRVITNTLLFILLTSSGVNVSG